MYYLETQILVILLKESILCKYSGVEGYQR